MSRPGDWNCRSCNHLNFQRRDSCQRCGDARSAGADFSAFRATAFPSFGGAAGYSSGPDVRPGDWYCAVGNCGAHNFASRSTCFKCGAYKEDVSSGGGFDADLSARRGFGGGFGFGFGNGTGGGGSSRSGWKSGDWICTWSGCNEHNFASRMECFRCSAPRDASSKSSY
ncbi:hypothetical protein V2J09_007965 [Rumex salicifolius]